MTHDQKLAHQALLLEGELKKTSLFLSEHEHTLHRAEASGNDVRSRDILDLAAFCSAYWQTTERLFKLCFKVYGMEDPDTLQHHEAGIDAAARASKTHPGIVPPEAVPGLRQICRLHYRTRHLKPEELAKDEVLAGSRLVYQSWAILKPWYKELYKTWVGPSGF